jgi:hypothetical protein
MSVGVSSMFVLSCVGRDVATELITRPKKPTDYEIHNSRLILVENKPEILIRNVKVKKGKNIPVTGCGDP